MKDNKVKMAMMIKEGKVTMVLKKFGDMRMMPWLLHTCCTKLTGALIEVKVVCLIHLRKM